VLAAIEDLRVIALAPDRFGEEVLRICQKKTLPLPTGAAIANDDAWARFLEIMTSPIVLLPSDELHERAWDLAHSAGLTTHDALYLALAERWGAELWTLDDLLAGPTAAR
jgi:predicted nucleic acid-binding protein